MQKLFCLLTIMILTNSKPILAQDQTYYGFVLYEDLNKNVLYISKLMKTNKYYETKGFMGSGYTKRDEIEKGIEKDFIAKIYVQEKIKAKHSVSGGFNLRSLFADVVDTYSRTEACYPCDCLWQYDCAEKKLTDVINRYTAMEDVDWKIVVIY